MNRLPHLNDEAVAAFADGVLRDAPRARAGQHLAECPECAAAVQEQRHASYALRAAHAPSLPSGLMQRLRELPITAPLPQLDLVTGLTADGRPVFAAYAAALPVVVPTTLPVPTALPVALPTESGAQHRSRRSVLPGIGLGAMAAAAVVVGALASTAATAGGARSGPVAGPGGSSPTSSVRSVLPVNRDALLLSGRP